MAKIARNGTSGRFIVASDGEGKRTTIRDARSGKTLTLKGYGSMKGEFQVRKGLNLSQPIAAQAAKRKSGKGSAAKAS